MRRLAVLALLVLLCGPVAAVERGSVRVVSQTGVEVLWEGVSLGVTDAAGALVVGEVPPGEYTLTLKKRGFETEKVDVVVEAGTTVLSLRLEPLPAPPKPQIVVVPKPEPAAATAPARTAPSESKPAGRQAQETPGAGVSESGVPESGVRGSGDRPDESEAAGAGGESPTTSGDEVSLPVESPVETPAESTAEAAVAANGEDEGGFSGVALVLALAVLGAGGAFFYLRGRQAVGATERSPRVVRIERGGGSGRGRGSSFLEDLRRRERALEKLVDVPAEGRGGEIIDVEVETGREESSKG